MASTKKATDIKPGDTVVITITRAVSEVTLHNNGAVDVTFTEGEPQTFDCNDTVGLG